MGMRFMRIRFFALSLTLLLLIPSLINAETIISPGDNVYIIEGLESEQPITSSSTSSAYDITLTISTQPVGTSSYMPVGTNLYTVCLGYQCVIPRLFATTGWTQVYDSGDSVLYPGYGEAGGRVYSSSGQLVIENQGTPSGKKYGVVSSRIQKEQGIYTAAVSVKCDYLSAGTLTLETFDSSGNKIFTVDKTSSPAAGWQILQVQTHENKVGTTGAQNIFLHVDAPGRCYFKEPRLTKGTIPLDFDISGTAQTECCPAGYCWSGSGCIENQANEPWESPVLNSIDGNYGYRCIDGNWVLSQKKTAWDENLEGYCPSNLDCLVNPKENLDFYKSLSDYAADPDSYYSEEITTASPSIQCINNKEYLADHYCKNGNWSTRTRQIAIDLIDFAEKKSLKDYVLYCEDYEKALADYMEEISGMPVKDFITGEEISRFSKEYSCFSNKNYKMPCANNFCVLKTPEQAIIGASLNRHITEFEDNIPTPFISTLKDRDGGQLRTGLCDNVLNKLNEQACLNDISQCDKYIECGDGNEIYDNYLWYNPVKKSFIYSKSENGVSIGQQSLTDYFASPYQTIVNFVISMWKPTFGLNKQYTFIEKARDFNEIYLSKNSNERIILGAREKKEKEYYSFEFSGFSSATDIKTAVEKLKAENNIDIDVVSGCGRHYLITQEPNAMLYFADLSAKLRVQPQETPPEECKTCNDWETKLGAVTYTPDSETCAGEDLFPNTLFKNGDSNGEYCCLGKVIPKSCSEIGGKLCSSKQGCSGDAVNSAESNANLICCKEDCGAYDCADFGYGANPSINICSNDDICDGVGIVAGTTNCCIGSCKDTSPPGAPALQSPTVNVQIPSVTLTWTAPTDTDITSYNIYRSLSSAFNDQNLIGTTAELTYTDSAVQNDITYYYKLRAVDTSNNIGAFSNPASAKVG